MKDYQALDQCEKDLDSAKMYVEIAQEKPDDPRSLRYALNAIENAREQHEGAVAERDALRAALAEMDRYALGFAGEPAVAAVYARHGLTAIRGQ